MKQYDALVISIEFVEYELESETKTPEDLLEFLQDNIEEMNDAELSRFIRDNYMHFSPLHDTPATRDKQADRPSTKCPTCPKNRQ